MTAARVYVADCALEVGAEDLHLAPNEMYEEAAHQWANGKDLAEMTGALARYLAKSAQYHGSIPKVNLREVWWYRIRHDGAPVLVTVELITRPLFEDHLAHVAKAGVLP